MPQEQTNYFVRSPVVGYLIGAVWFFLGGFAVYAGFTVEGAPGILRFGGFVGTLLGLLTIVGAFVSRGPTIVATELGIVIRPRRDRIELGWNDIAEIKSIGTPPMAVAFYVHDAEALVAKLPRRAAMSVQHCLKRSDAVAVVPSILTKGTPKAVAIELTALQRQNKARMRMAIAEAVTVSG